MSLVMLLWMLGSTISPASTSNSRKYQNCRILYNACKYWVLVNLSCIIPILIHNFLMQIRRQIMKPKMKILFYWKQIKDYKARTSSHLSTGYHRGEKIWSCYSPSCQTIWMVNGSRQGKRQVGNGGRYKHCTGWNQKKSLWI